ncbi:hypothetical protein AB0M57_06965 [Streptomyces sp. NPDC051597]
MPVRTVLAESRRAREELNRLLRLADRSGDGDAAQRPPGRARASDR